MIEENPYFSCPPNHYTLWRYMNLSAFITLLDDKALYFSRLDEFEDKWEGSPPLEYIFRLARGHRPEFVSQQLMLTETAKRVAVSCWHMNPHESVAMWNLYTKGVDGVAIATTVGRLKDVLQADTRRFVIGRVSYRDEENGFDFNSDDEIYPLRPIFEKRLSYEHEKEVRIVCTDSDSSDKQKVKENRGLGIRVPVDLGHLVMRVVAAERFPKWALPTLQKLVDYEHTTITIEDSDLPRPPFKLSDFEPKHSDGEDASRS